MASAVRNPSLWRSVAVLAVVGVVAPTVVLRAEAGPAPAAVATATPAPAAIPGPDPGVAVATAPAALGESSAPRSANASPGGVPAPPDGLDVGDPVPGQYLVTTRPGHDPAAVARAFQDDGVRPTATFDTVTNGFVARVPERALRRLRNDPDVVLVEPDRVVGLVNTTQTNAPWGLDRVEQRALPLSGDYTYATTAKGVSVYVVDTGILRGHEEFGGRVSAGFDVFGTGSTTDCHGHGTHVAGTVGGVNFGVAKAVTLVPVRVLDCKGSGTTSGVIAGIDWVTEQHRAGTPAVANLSLGGGASPTLDTAVRNSIAAGVTYVVAAGNSDADACNFSPARVAEAITVGATNKSDSRASFSNFGSCLDVFAPGVSITSAGIASTTATVQMSGTSMASPHVAGIVALYLAELPDTLAATVVEEVVSGATTGVVTSAGNGSPNRLSFSQLTAVSGDTTPPGPVTDLRLTARDRRVTLRWTNPSAPDLDVVVVQMAQGGTPPSSPAEGTRVYRGTGTSVRKTGLKPRTDYSFSVFALDLAGNVSDPSRLRAYGSKVTSPSARPARLIYTASTTVRGTITQSGSGLTLPDVPVVVEHRPKGASAWSKLATVTASATGEVVRSHKPPRTTQYRLRYRGGGNVLGTFSTVQTVAVRPLVASILSSSSVRSGDRALLRGRVSPSHRGQKVVLRRQRPDGSWRNVTATTLNAKSRYRFRLPTGRAGSVTYRVRKPADSDHLVGFSNPRTLTVR